MSEDQNENELKSKRLAALKRAEQAGRLLREAIESYSEHIGDSPVSEEELQRFDTMADGMRQIAAIFQVIADT